MTILNEKAVKITYNITIIMILRNYYLPESNKKNYQSRLVP